MGNNGEIFLEKLYKDLCKVEKKDIEELDFKTRRRVFAEKHITNPSDSRQANISTYMEKLDRVHKKASDLKLGKTVLYKLYHDKYVIKKEDMSSNLSDEEKETIITEQKKTLDKWLDYLTDDSAMYPMWAKYWVFQSMLKIGTYNEANDTYMRRSAKTAAPFISADPEIIAKCIDLVQRELKKEKIEDEELATLIESGNFVKLYTLLQTRNKNKINRHSGTEGVWIKYEMGSKESATKLCDSLQGHNTHWCTASIQTAIEQICGGEEYPGGDFYVYYTKDETGEFKVPRIAIRMNGHDEIGEIRGVADESQNMESGFEDVVQEKLETFPNLSNAKKIRYLQAIEDARMLTKLNQKVTRKEELTLEEINFLYEVDRDIVNFGWNRDSRIEIIKSNAILCKEANNVKSIMIKIVELDGHALEYASEELRNDKTFILRAVSHNVEVLEWINDGLKKDRCFILQAVRQNGRALGFASEELRNDKDFVIEAITKNSYALGFASEELRNDREIVLSAIKQNGCVLQCISEELRNDREIVLTAVRQDYSALGFVGEKLKKDREIILAAIKEDADSLYFVSEELRNDRTFMLQAISQNSEALGYASKELKKDKSFMAQVETMRKKRALKKALSDIKKAIMPNKSETKEEKNL